MTLSVDNYRLINDASIHPIINGKASIITDEITTNLKDLPLSTPRKSTPL